MRSVSTDADALPPLRICVVATNGPAPPGGLSAVVRQLLEHLSASDDVTCVARFGQPHGAELRYDSAEEPRTERHEGVDVNIVAPPRWTAPLLRLARRLMYYPSAQGAASRIFRLAYTRALAAAIPAEVDVVHSVGTGWEMLGCTAERIARRRGAAFTICPAIHPGTWGDSAFDARYYRRADAVVALSGHEGRRLRALGVAPERIVVTGLGASVDLTGEASRLRTRYHLNGRPLVLFVGRKQRYKGYHVLCEALRLVRDEVRNATLIALGPDGDQPYPELPADAVVDLGAASHEEKEDALAACDVLCMPSSGEAFGIAYVEAWAYGKPVIGGPAPAVRELIRDGIDGLCVDQDAGQTAQALERCLTDPKLAERLGEAGRARQRAEFTWPHVVARHRELFARLTSAPAASAPPSLR